MNANGPRDRILVVDDSLTVRMDLGESLQDAGYEVDLAATLADARVHLARGGHGLVLLDVQLPDGDGVEFLAELRAGPLSAALRVILMSTEAQVHDRVRGMQRAADDYVGKPYATSYLVHRAAEFLRQDSTAATSAMPVVLLADDSATHRHHLRELLVQRGFRVLLSATGEDALMVARRELPDLLILDVILPGLSGFQILRRLRMDTALRSVPVIMLTGADGAGDELAGLESGADAYVRKGEDFEILHARLNALLRATHTRQAREPSESATQKVLVVDPQLEYRARVADQLREDGYDTILAGSGEEAMQLLPVQTIDAILLDRALPGLTSGELCAQIKAHAEWRHIPVLMRAAEDRPQVMLASLAEGADDFLPRSAGVAVLRARLSAQLRRKHYEDENRRELLNRSREQLAVADVLSARSLAETRERHVAELQAKNAELDVARAAAEEATRAKALFLATMSHEIRTPMNAIIGMTDLLGATTLNTTQREYLDIIRSGGRHLLSVINDILDFSKIESGHMELEETPFDLRRCVDEAIKLVAQKAAEKRLPLRCHYEPGIPQHIVGDSVRVRQVLVNYLSNAIKFTAEGEVSVHIALVAQQQRDCELRFEVRDSGVGIPPEHLGKLFQSFRQVDASTTRVYGGSGLGLAICKRLAEAMGGRVGVQSAVGKGSAFHFFIRARLAEEAAVLPPQITDSETVPAAPAADLSILLVEDTPTNQTVARLMLAAIGLRRVEIVDNGALAVAACATRSFDVVLMDVQMPVMDGLEASRQIRALPLAWPQPRIIAMTANAFSSDREECLAVGMDDYVSKPIERARLAEALGRITATRGCGGSSRAQEPVAISFQEINPDNLSHMQETMDEAGVLEVIEAIVVDAPRLLTGIRGAAARTDRKALRLHAHSIRSTCSMLGARGAGDLYHQIELGAETEPGTAFDAAVLSAEHRYQNVIDEIRRWSAALIAHP